MNTKLDINIFSDENGFFVLEYNGGNGRLITPEVLEDSEYLAAYIKKAIIESDKKAYSERVIKVMRLKGWKRLFPKRFGL